jgi:hypothetical protein
MLHCCTLVTLVEPSLFMHCSTTRCSTVVYAEQYGFCHHKASHAGLLWHVIGHTTGACASTAAHHIALLCC